MVRKNGSGGQLALRTVASPPNRALSTPISEEPSPCTLLHVASANVLAKA